MVFLFCCIAFSICCLGTPAQPAIVNGHAHNDYEQQKPLFTALKNGFKSVEADIHLIDGVLYVSHHYPKDLPTTPNLEDLYLKPLKNHIDQNGGRVYPDYDDFFYLMIDVKSNAVDTYHVLEALLKNYQSMISVVRNNQDQLTKPVKVFISGNRPVQLLLAKETKYAGLDGRPEDLTAKHPNTLMPIISENFNHYLSWDGMGEPEDQELVKLLHMIEKAHAQHKQVRLWAAPDSPSAWELLLDIGIDLINTDHIPEFKEFFLRRE